MTMLASFITTSTWQELTGVSEIESSFTIQNRGHEPFMIYIGTTANDVDAIVIDPVSKQGKPSEWGIDGTSTTEKVWVKSDQPTRIAINKD